MHHGITPRTSTHDRVATASRHTEPLEPGEALKLLGTVPLGRIVFTRHALPAVRPVNHLVDGGDIIIGLYDGADVAALTAPDDCLGIVVAYQADAIDPTTHLGWSVVATGYALTLDGPATQRYAELLRPWRGGPESTLLSIRPDLITGFRVEAA